MTAEPSNGSVPAPAVSQAPAETPAPPAWTAHEVDVTVHDTDDAQAFCHTCGSRWVGRPNAVNDWADGHRADTTRRSGPLRGEASGAPSKTANDPERGAN